VGVAQDRKLWFKSVVHERSRENMSKQLTLIYWKSEKFWLGKLLEHPEIMTQGETLEELEENIKDACLLMTMS